jgi:hypothetical protein
VNGAFVIPDIVLHIEDENGPAVIAFEVKKPGTAPTTKDALKLSAYSRLPSMQDISRTYSCFLVGEKAAATAATLSPDSTVLTWEAMRILLLKAVENECECDQNTALVKSWVDRAFSRYGLSAASAPESQAGASRAYGTSAAYQAIDALNLSPRMMRFLKGSEAVEAFYLREQAEPPMAWLSHAPSRQDMSDFRYQQTSDRQINRWSPKWRAEVERAVP